MKKAVYAGTFDPVTNGHLDLLHRALKIFDHVTIAVAENREKHPLFNSAERVALIEPNNPDPARVTVTAFDGLLVDFAREQGMDALIRGIRAVSDFEYEFQMTHMNRHLHDDLETLFLMPTEQHFYTSSSVTKAVARYGGDVSELVPPNVYEALRARFAEDSR